LRCCESKLSSERELATGFSGKTQTTSDYKRLQRFFRHYEMNYAEIAQAVVALIAIPEPWVLAIDRTESQFGDCVFNISKVGGGAGGGCFPSGIVSTRQTR